MKRLLFLFIILLLTVSSFAQESNRKKKKQKHENTEMKADTVFQPQHADDSDEKDVLKNTINSLNPDLSHLQSEVKTLRTDSTKLSKQIEQKQDTIQQLRNEIEIISSDRDKYKQKYDRIVERINAMDAVVYKQCLLYPLEARYNEASIQDALEAVYAFAQLNSSPSQKFTEYRKIYEPLLNDYSNYNQELKEFLDLKLSQVKMTNGVISEAHKEKFRDEIKKLKYFNLYKDRNKPRYESIIYLDEAIDKFLAILKKDGKVENDIEELIKSLEPKQQNTNQ